MLVGGWMRRKEKEGSGWIRVWTMLSAGSRAGTELGDIRWFECDAGICSGGSGGMEIDIPFLGDGDVHCIVPKRRGCL